MTLHRGPRRQRIQHGDVAACEYFQIGNNNAYYSPGLKNPQTFAQEPGSPLPIDVLKHVTMVNGIECALRKWNPFPEVPTHRVWIQLLDALITFPRKQAQAAKRPAKCGMAPQSNYPTEVNVVPSRRYASIASEVEQRSA